MDWSNKFIPTILFTLRLQLESFDSILFKRTKFFPIIVLLLEKSIRKDVFHDGIDKQI